ncbi:MAG: hypothetical protein LV479_02645 [Methylacidiphilales bacterium]|nr:hypothetical protein [Candidatus Methylacidiphilales bacterium]
MKKGQGASKRKTFYETIYGSAAAGEAGKHLALLDNYDDAIGELRLFLCTPLLATPDRIKQFEKDIMQKIAERHLSLFASWERVRRQPETLRKLADIADRDRDKKDPTYTVENAVLIAYGYGERSHQKLLDLASKQNPEITESTFSRIVKRYGLKLIKAKPGPKPERKKQSGRK